MRSHAIKHGPDHAPARAMLRATGRDDAAIAKPFVAIVHSWSDVSPCNLTLRALAQHVRRGVEANGGTAIEFNQPEPIVWDMLVCRPEWAEPVLAALADIL